MKALNLTQFCKSHDQAKYHNSPYLNPMIGVQARAATVKVMPHETANN